MINQIIKEINACLKNGCYIAALTTALTLPDICGKVEYPNDGNSSRYKKWYFLSTTHMSILFYDILERLINSIILKMRI